MIRRAIRLLPIRAVLSFWLGTPFYLCLWAGVESLVRSRWASAFPSAIYVEKLLKAF